MKKVNNNKGFTMVELLAVITVLGILSTVAIVAVSRYIYQARDDSYDSMLSAAYEATQTYVMEKGLDNKLLSGAVLSVNINQLIENDLMEKPINPQTHNADCTGTVKFKLKKTADLSKVHTVDTIVYQVSIHCPPSTDKVQIFPKDAVYQSETF